MNDRRQRRAQSKAVKEDWSGETRAFDSGIICKSYVPRSWALTRAARMTCQLHGRKILFARPGPTNSRSSASLFFTSPRHRAQAKGNEGVPKPRLQRCLHIGVRKSQHLHL